MKRIETQRLILREWKENDVHDLFEIMKSNSVLMGGWMPHYNMCMTEKVLESYIKSDDSWAIELKESNRIIGFVRIPVDSNRGKFNARSINYALSDSCSGNGFMTEAVRAVIKFVFEEMNIDLLSAFHYSENVKSKQVLERCGFEYEGIIKQGCKRFDGKVFDAVCHSILKSDYCNLENE